jgi:two-component system, cell cycle sensor histidine kinase and response regulator CckA
MGKDEDISMKKSGSSSKDKTELRRLAEKHMSEQKNAKDFPIADTDQKMLLHELQVHQIELEMQNEELRRIQEELEAEKERYTDLYAFAPVGYITVSEKGVVQEANLTAATLLGITWNELIRQPLTGFILPEDQDIYYRLCKKLLDTGEKQACELRMLGQGREPFWARLEATLAWDGRSGPREYRVVMSDITVHKHLEEEKARLLSQNQQLQKAESLSRMAAAIAHSFNNILGAVMGNLELAMDDLSRDHGCFASLTEAMKAAQKAAQVSGLMLTYLGHTPGMQISLDLSEVCHRILSVIRAAMPENITIEADFPASGPVISADENQIYQILINLITNAWESSHDGQVLVCLSVKSVAPSEISSKFRIPMNWAPEAVTYAGMEVKDNGSGISNDDIKLIFDPFYSSKFIGRGMGLSVVQGIVQAHKGVITVDSAPGRGSRFGIYFPVCNEQFSGKKHETIDGAPVRR